MARYFSGECSADLAHDTFGTGGQTASPERASSSRNGKVRRQGSNSSPLLPEMISLIGTTASRRSKIVTLDRVGLARRPRARGGR